MKCYLCPLKCGVDRTNGIGLCGAGRLPRVANFGPHYWEEPCISGPNGSGAIFFSGCNMHCIFCQNYELNDGTLGTETSVEELTGIMMFLQQRGCSNINLVTAGPHLGTVIPALRRAKENGLTIPVVYNTNAFETVAAIRALKGLVDIYLPDFKYVSNELSSRFSSTPAYFSIALNAIGEMIRQVGQLHYGPDGMADSGVIIRHLVLPNCLNDSRNVLRSIADHFSCNVTLSLMRQYAPTPNITDFPLNRKLTDREYDRIVSYCIDLGFTNVFIQEKSSASLTFTPDFHGKTMEV